MRSSKHTDFETLGSSAPAQPQPTNWVTVLKFAAVPVILLLVLFGSGIFLLAESTSSTCSSSNLIGGVFCQHYVSRVIGPIPGLAAFYGGLGFIPDDPNTVLVAGHADTPQGALYKVCARFSSFNC